MTWCTAGPGESRSICRTSYKVKLIINPHKCVEYLDFVIGFGRVKPQLEKMVAIQSFPALTTKRKMRGWLPGWVEHKICPLISRELNYFTEDSAPNKVHRTEECAREFKDLKEAIITQPVLHSPEFDKSIHPADRCIRSGLWRG